jgi:hypothetical protein
MFHGCTMRKVRLFAAYSMVDFLQQLQPAHIEDTLCVDAHSLISSPARSCQMS